MMKKMFFIFLIFLFFLTNVNAIVVQDISEQIQQGNTQIIENNAKIQGNVSQLQSQLTDLTATIEEMKTNQLNKSDMGLIRDNVDQAMIIWQQQMLIMFLFIVFFAYAIGLFGKSKGWF